MLKTPPRFYVPVILGLLLSGCGQGKPATTTTTTATSSTKSTTDGQTATKESSTDVKTAPELKPTADPAAAGPTKPPAFSEAAYLGNDVVGIVMVHPRRLTEWNVYQTIMGSPVSDEMKANMAASPVQPESIERAVLVLDQTWLNALAKMAGLEVKEADNQAEMPADDDMGFGPPLPTLIVTLANASDGEAAKALFPESETVDGETLQSNDFAAAWFSADNRTVLVGPKSGLSKLLATKKSGKHGSAKVLAQLNPSADFSLAISLESQSALLAQAVEQVPVPGLALAQQIHGLALHLNLTGKPGDKLLELVATATDETAGDQLSALITGQLEFGKGLAQQQLTENPGKDDSEKAASQMAHKAVESATIKQTGAVISFSVLIPEGYDKLPEMLKPALEQAQGAAKATQKKNHLKQIGLAFYNYHDTFNKFPGAGKSADEKTGLSWRVYLLPFLDEGALYQEFKFDEPWDSEHNKALIERMPDVFKTDGVTEAGKTAMHVFTGPGAPFADDKTPAIRDFTDGTSNTILVVVAGPDKAEVWTKPGGLDFDPKDAIKALGELPADQFLALLCDGSVRAISKMVDLETLRRLIQSQDGEPIADF